MPQLVTQNEILFKSNQEVRSSILVLHEAYCERNIIKCSQCNEMIDSNLQDEHMETHLKSLFKISCDYCQKSFQQQEVKRHELNCENKPQYCEYCNLTIKKEEYIAHISKCGTRTEQCDLCQKYVQKLGKCSFFSQFNQDFHDHFVICQFNHEEFHKQQDFQQKTVINPVPNTRKHIKISSDESENGSDESFRIEENEKENENHKKINNRPQKSWQKQQAALKQLSKDQQTKQPTKRLQKTEEKNQEDLDEDADFQMALAMSLQEQPDKKKFKKK